MTRRCGTAADFSLAESLRTIPGFRVQQLGGFGRTATIKTRGLRNQDTAILIDGIRFRDASAITGDASPFLSDFTLTSVPDRGAARIGIVVVRHKCDRRHGRLSNAAGGERHAYAVRRSVGRPWAAAVSG